MSRKLQYLHPLVLFLCCLHLRAQHADIASTYLPPSPTASSLVNFAETPVSYSTGLPNINIPIHSLQSDKLRSDVSISYHAGGIKVQQIASQVGLGWSLNNGGVISRAVFGRADFSSLGYQNITFDENSNSDKLNAVTLNWDLEPDLFTFSFGGFSGKFFMTKDGQIHQYKNSTLLIKHIAIGDTWQIIDEGGTIYNFNQKEEGEFDPDDGCGSTFNPIGLETTTSWYLTSVYSHDYKDTIQYTYVNRGFHTLPEHINESQFFLFPYSGSCGCSSLTSPVSCSSVSRSQSTDITEIIADYQRIEFLYSNRSDISNLKKLDRVNVYNRDKSKLLKYYVLSYDYYLPGNNKLRLTGLQEFGKEGNTTKSIPRYSFDYSADQIATPNSMAIDHWGFQTDKVNNTSLLPQIPATMSSTNQYFGNAKRAPDTLSRHGLLSRIDYPTGWYEDFKYENHYYSGLKSPNILASTQGVLNVINMTASSSPQTFTICEEFPNVEFTFQTVTCPGGPDDCINAVDIKDSLGNIVVSLFDQEANTTTMLSLGAGDYTLEVGSPTLAFTAQFKYYERDLTTITERLAGGARIKSITTPDGTKSYTYTRGDTISSGVLLDVPRYFINQSQTISCGSSPINCGFECLGIQYFSSSNASSVSPNLIMYTDVQEIFEDGGELHSQFDFYPDANPSNQLPILPASSNEVRRGNLIKQTTYKRTSPTQLQEVAETVYLYESIRDTTISCFRLYNTAPFCQSGAKVTARDYFQASHTIRPTSMASTSYSLDGTQSVTTTTDYTYDADYPTLVATSSSINSDGKDYVMESSYATSYTPNTGIRNKLVTQNRVMPPWQTLKKVDGTIVDGSQTIYSYYAPSGNPALSASDYLYPIETKRREVTWDASNTLIDSSWILQKRIPQYQMDVGKPTRLLARGWQDTIKYTWSTTGRLKQWQFIDMKREYDYYADTDLLETSTAIDQTTTNYAYDGFFRTKTISNCQGATTTFTYHYTTGGNDKNYVRSYTLYPEFGEQLSAEIIENKQFIDGLGREIQSLRINQAPDNTSQHIATWTTYDAVGRPTRQYDPKVVTSASYTVPSGDYVETLYEASPLHRPISTKHSDWHATETIYSSNIANEVLDLSAGGGYPANSLNKIISRAPTTSGNFTEQISYVDKRGREVLMRTRDDDTGATTNTYKTYDDKDRPHQILPPGTTIADADLIFTNVYHPDDNLWQKKFPDQALETFVYNQRDLLAYRQDGHLNERTKWMATNYDPYGRMIHEGFTDATPGVNGTFATASVVDTLFKNTYGSSGIEIDKLIANSAKLLNAPGSIIRYKSYDACGRNDHTWGNTIMNLDDINSYDMVSTFDDADHIITTTEQVPHNSTGALTILTSMGYDHAGRQTSEAIKINNLTQQTISATTYTAKEQVKKLTLGGGLQEIDYTYKENGFLEKINQPFSLGTDLFAMELGYDTELLYPSNTTTRKDGNITSIHWRVPGSNRKAYQYKYDYRSWLKSADYLEPGNNGTYSSSYGYIDDRGNPDTIRRNGIDPSTMLKANDPIDQLTLSYWPGTNRIKRVSDGTVASLKSLGYKSLPNEDYEYDNNGAITHDPSRGAGFTRNHMDLPNKIEIPDSNGIVMYYYSADGQLQQQEEIRNDEIVKIRNYIGSTEYINGAIEQIRHNNGYITLDNGLSEEHLNLSGTETINKTYESLSTISERNVPSPRITDYYAEQFIILTPGFNVNLGADFTADIKDYAIQGLDYRYFIKDHLGSVRVEFGNNNGVASLKTESHSYPFGYSMLGPWSSTDTKNNYLFTGQEQQTSFDLGYQRYEFRYGDPLIMGRFDAPDPISQQFAWASSYNYAENSPVANIDLHGLQAAPVVRPGLRVIRGGAIPRPYVRPRNDYTTYPLQETIDRRKMRPHTREGITIRPSGTSNTNFDTGDSKLDEALTNARNNMAQSIVNSHGGSDREESGGDGNSNSKKDGGDGGGATGGGDGGDDDGDGTNTKKERVRTKSELERALNQLEGIERAQSDAKNEKVGQKQNRIYSSKKSEQRANHALKRIRSRKDLEEN